MKFVIIGAMAEEVNYLIANIPLINKKRVKSLDYEYLIGDYDLERGIEVIIGTSGIGRVASALLIANINYTFKLDNNDYIVNIGTAGGTSKANLEDIIVAKDSVYGDVDLAIFSSNYRYGQMSGCPFSFKGNDKLVGILEKSNLNLKFGAICTNESFSVDASKCNKLIDKHFSDLNVLAFDMETAAYAQSCYKMNNNFLAIRYISDIIGMENQDMTFEEHVSRSAKKEFKIIMYLLDNI